MLKKILNTILLLSISIKALSLAGSAFSYLKQTIQNPKVEIMDLSTTKVNFGNDFLWGIGTSSGQVEDNLNNTWTLQDIADHGLCPSSFNCGSFTHWQDDIDKVVHLGCNSYRLSIEWSRVEPTEGTFNEQALLHYQNICKKLVEKNITPMICLHHYTDPQWFLAKGGFTRPENIVYFTKYANKVAEYLSEYVTLWIPISQPAAYALKGYKSAMHPPFENDLNKAGQVALNMMNAHVASYKILKKVNPENQVGICHQIVDMHASRLWHPLDHLCALFADRLYNKSLLRFFTTGKFRWLKPKYTIASNPEAPECFDFFGLSYYSPLYFKGTQSCQINTDPQRATNDEIRVISEQGMYKAIQAAASLNKPVYVVENGINTTNENKKIFFFNSQISAIWKAIDDGYDVRGYLPWTLMDNYEWGYKENSKHFGLYKNRMISATTMQPSWKDHNSMLKPSGQHYKNIIRQQS